MKLFYMGLTLLLALAWAPLTGGQTAAALSLTSELSWGSPCQGDPLRVRVRLTSPRARQDLHRRMLRGESTNGEAFAMPVIATNWHEGVSLKLVRVQTDGTRQVVLAPDQWAAFLRPQSPGARDFEGLLLARSREWLVSPQAAGLSAGAYEVEASWQGASYVDATYLPTGGVLTAATLTFNAATITSAAQQADHLGRLAYYSYMTGDYAQARDLSRKVAQLDPSGRTPERVDAWFMAAHAALRMNDPLAAAEAYNSLARLFPAGESTELTSMARERLEILAPRLQLPPGAQGEQPFRLQITSSWPEQRYVTYASPDLKTWTPVSTNVALTNLLDVLDAQSTNYYQRYYRVIWTP